MKPRFRRATIADAKEIKKLVDIYSKRNEMLPKSFHDIYENIRDYHVAVQKNQVIACCALHIVWENLAEIRSLAVAENAKKRGIGQILVNRCVKEARELGLPRVFCLTYVPDFFAKCGFSRIDKSELPHKVWGDCVRCNKFPDCGEVPMALDLN